MEAYTVAGGALAGIGAVAALPIMWPIGAVSLVGAPVGGTLGGVAGAGASEIEKSPKCHHPFPIVGIPSQPTPDAT